MLKKIKNEISEILDSYMKSVGCGFFTRNSRINLARNLRNAINENNTKEMIRLVLNFSISMQGPSADVGCLGRSRLHNAFWGGTLSNRRDGVYQKLYEYVFSEEGKRECGNLSVLKNGTEVKLNLDNCKQVASFIGYNWAGNHGLHNINIKKGMR